MSRTPRFTMEYGTYHIMSRGHNKRNIFHSASDFEKYLNILTTNRTKYSIKIYRYTPMTNHTHLIIMVPDLTNLSNSMRFLNQSYAHYYRKKYGGVGYVWQDRYKSFLIHDGIYLLECSRYVEMNLVMAGIVSPPEEYQWPSYNVYIQGNKTGFIGLDPEYMTLSDNPQTRRKLYKQFISEGIKEKRILTRYFKVGVYGNEKFINVLIGKGLKKTNWKMGRPHK